MHLFVENIISCIAVFHKSQVLEKKQQLIHFANVHP
jgi:hypothetical protein